MPGLEYACDVLAKTFYESCTNDTPEILDVIAKSNIVCIDNHYLNMHVDH